MTYVHNFPPAVQMDDELEIIQICARRQWWRAVDAIICRPNERDARDTAEIHRALRPLIASERRVLDDILVKLAPVRTLPEDPTPHVVAFVLQGSDSKQTLRTEATGMLPVVVEKIRKEVRPGEGSPSNSDRYHRSHSVCWFATGSWRAWCSTCGVVHQSGRESLEEPCSKPRMTGGVLETVPGVAPLPP